jgi:hypothetical protein
MTMITIAIWILVALLAIAVLFLQVISNELNDMLERMDGIWDDQPQVFVRDEKGAV